MPVSVSVDVDLRQLQQVMARLSPVVVAMRSKAAMGESLAYLQAEVQKNTPVDTGITRGSIFTASRGSSLADLRGTVASPLEHTIVLEEGRRPGGRMPPVAIIERWAQRVIGVSGLGYVIARAIARRGTKAHHMFRNAADRGRVVVQSIWLRHFRGF